MKRKMMRIERMITVVTAIMIREILANIKNIGDQYLGDIVAKNPIEVVNNKSLDIYSIFDEKFQAFSVLRGSTQIVKSMKNCSGFGSTTIGEAQGVITMVCIDPEDGISSFLHYSRFKDGVFSTQKFVNLTSFVQGRSCLKSYTQVLEFGDERIYVLCSKGQGNSTRFRLISFDLSKPDQIIRDSFEIKESELSLKEIVKTKILKSTKNELFVSVISFPEAALVDNQGEEIAYNNRKLYLCSIKQGKFSSCSLLDLGNITKNFGTLYDVTMGLNNGESFEIYVTFHLEDSENVVALVSLQSINFAITVKDFTIIRTTNGIKASSFNQHFNENVFTHIEYIVAQRRHRITQFKIQGKGFTEDVSSPSFVSTKNSPVLSDFGDKGAFVRYTKGGVPYSLIAVYRDTYRLAWIKNDTQPLYYEQESRCLVVYQNNFLKSICDWDLSFEIETNHLKNSGLRSFEFGIKVYPVTKDRNPPPLYIQGVTETNFWDIKIGSLETDFDIFLNEYSRMPFTEMRYHSNQVMVSPESGVEVINENFNTIKLRELIPLKYRKGQRLETGMIQRYQILAMNETTVMVFRNRELLVRSEMIDHHRIKKLVNYYTQQKLICFAFINQDNKTVLVEWHLEEESKNSKIGDPRKGEIMVHVLDYKAELVIYSLNAPKKIIRVAISAPRLKILDLLVKRNCTAASSKYTPYWKNKSFSNLISRNNEICASSMYIKKIPKLGKASFTILSNCDGYNFIGRAMLDDDKEDLEGSEIFTLDYEVFKDRPINGCVFSNSAVFYDRERKIVKIVAFDAVSGLKEVDLRTFNFSSFGEYSCSSSVKMLVLLAYRVNPATGMNSTSIIGVTAQSLIKGETDSDGDRDFRNRINFIEVDLPVIAKGIKTKSTYNKVLITLQKEDGDFLYCVAKIKRTCLYFKTRNMTRETQKRYITFESFSFGDNRTSYGLRLTQKSNQCGIVLVENPAKIKLSHSIFKLRDLISYNGALIDAKSNSKYLKISPRYEVQHTDMMSELKWIYKYMNYIVPVLPYKSPKKLSFAGLLNEDSLLINSYGKVGELIFTIKIVKSLSNSAKFRVSDDENNVIGLVTTRKSTEMFTHRTRTNSTEILQIESSGNSYTEYAFSLHDSNVNVYGALTSDNSLELYIRMLSPSIGYERDRVIDMVFKFDVVEFGDASLVIYSKMNQKYSAQVSIYKENFNTYEELFNLDLIQSAQILDIRCQPENQDVVNCFVLSNCFMQQAILYKNRTLERYDYDTFTYDLYPGIVPLTLSLGQQHIIVKGFQPDQSKGWFFFYKKSGSAYDFKKKVPMNAYWFKASDIEEVEKTTIGTFINGTREEFYFISPSYPTLQILRLYDQQVTVSPGITREIASKIRISLNSEVGSNKTYNLSSFFDYTFEEKDQMWFIKEWWFWVIVIISPILSAICCFNYCKYGRVPKRPKTLKPMPKLDEYSSMDDDDYVTRIQEINV